MCLGWAFHAGAHGLYCRLLLVRAAKAPSGLGSARLTQHPDQHRPQGPRSRSGVRRKCGLSVHSRTLAHHRVLQPALRLDLEAVEELVRQLAGEAGFPQPKGGDIPWALLETCRRPRLGVAVGRRNAHGGS
jgi:hypothetical protein